MKIKSSEFYTVKNLTGEDVTSKDGQDMLRYDRAFINPKLPGVVAFFRLGTPEGDYALSVTDARWRSYGFELQPLDTRRDDEYFALGQNIIPEHWFTYRRQPDQSLAPVFLSQVLAARDLSSI